MSYGPPPPTGYGSWQPYGPPPVHPKATVILVLGILSLVSCGLLGIPAWLMGTTALREIDASGGTIGGRDTVQAGRICGIVATVLLAVGLLLVVGMFALFAILATSVSTT